MAVMLQRHVELEHYTDTDGTVMLSARLMDGGYCVESWGANDEREMRGYAAELGLKRGASVVTTIRYRRAEHAKAEGR